MCSLNVIPYNNILGRSRNMIKDFGNAWLNISLGGTM